MRPARVRRPIVTFPTGETDEPAPAPPRSPPPSHSPRGAPWAECGTITFADVGWTDITATTAAATAVLDAMGYETDTKVLSLPVTFASLADGDVDVFLGNWMPTMEADIAPYREAGTIEEVRTNLTGAKYTLAANRAAAELGIDSFDDIATHADALDSTIYGIEPGNDGNRLILDMIEGDAFGLGRLRPRRELRAGDAGAGRARRPARRAGGVPRLGAPSR